MPDKLSQSLDQILSERRKQSTRRPRAARATVAKRAVAAPVGGIKKAVRGEKKVNRVTPTGPSGGKGDSKIIVSNLPLDVNEGQIKEYFSQTIGPVKKVDMSYALGGKSKGIATVIFTKSGSAAQAAKELDGLKVDTKPMRIEVIVGAKDAPAPPAPKTLSDRIAKPKPAGKDKPKPVTADKTKTAPAKGEKKPRGGRGRNAGRPKAKNADELDAEMQDYFATGVAGGDAPLPNGGAVQPTNGDAGMEDDVVA